MKQGLTPDIIFNPRSEYTLGQFVDQTARHIRCELRDAVRLAYINRDADFLDKWSAKVTLTLSADEKLNLSGSAGVGTDIADSTLKSFSLGFGGLLNQRATRKIDLTWYESFVEIRNEPVGNCLDEPAPRIEGNLKLKETLFTGVFPATTRGALFRGYADDGGPVESIQNTVTFNVEVGGTANPSFILTNAASNTGGPSILATRERLDQLLITMGPGFIEKTGRKLARTVVRPSREIIDAHNTGRINLGFQTYSPLR
jgi:hypothetical protein